MTADTGNPSARQALLELAERCEREEPSAVLNAVIYARLGFCLHINTTYEAVQGDSGRTCDDCSADSWGNKNDKGQRLHDPVPRFTSSLDAAVTLVPEGWCPADIYCTPKNVHFMLWNSATQRDAEGDAPTEAQARCAASLRARAQEAGE